MSRTISIMYKIKYNTNSYKTIVKHSKSHFLASSLTYTYINDLQLVLHLLNNIQFISQWYFNC